MKRHPIVKHTGNDNCPACALLRELGENLTDMLSRYSNERGLEAQDCLFAVATLLGWGVVAAQKDPSDEEACLATVNHYGQVFAAKAHDSFQLMKNGGTSILNTDDDDPKAPSTERRKHAVKLDSPANLHRRQSDISVDLQSLMRSLKSDGRIH